MTTERNIIIHQGQAFALSLDYAGTAGRGQRMHIRLADSTATVVQILTHNGDANARVLFDGTAALDITVGASVSAGWVVLADRVEWVYDIEDYDLADEDDCVIPYRGKVIVRGNRTRASDVTPSDQMPSGDGRYVRFDGAQGLSAGQQLQARENIGATLGTGDVVGPSSATDSRIAEFDGVTGKLIKQSSYSVASLIAYVVARAQHTGTQLAATISDFTSAAAAAAPVQSVAGRTGAVVIAVADVSGAESTANKAQANGYASLDSGGKVPQAQLPAIAITAHASNHAPGGSDALPWTTIHGRGLASARPTAAAGNAGYIYYSTDTQALERSTGSAWESIADAGGPTGFTAAESTSSPNATVPVASLTANNAATNVDAALRPKGTGAVLAHVPDSTATGGNKRGGYAVDMQLTRSTAAQVASGARSVISGGANNTASAADSTVVGGTSNTASAVGAVAGGAGNIASGAYSCAIEGVNATTRGVQASSAHAMQRRAADGDRQSHRMIVACAARTDATPTVMTSDAGAASATNQMVLPNNSSMFFEVDVVAHDSTLKSASWKVQGTIRRGANAAATAIVGTNVTTTFGSDLSGGSPGVTCTADTTNGALRVTFTGIAATTIYPSGHIRTVIAA